MLQRGHADLALDPRLVERDRTRPRAEAGNDGRDGRVVELDPLELRQDRHLPHFVAESGALAPFRARVRVGLAVAAVGDRPIALYPASADALNEALEESPGRRASVPLRGCCVAARRPEPRGSSETGGVDRHGAGLRDSWRLRR